MTVTVLSGGVGGARFLRGVVDAVDAADVTAVVNVGDDLEVLGLRVSPDLDSVVYALAGIADERRGWGRADETWAALETVKTLGGESWFALGDRDLGVHLVRTAWLRAGDRLSAVTERVARGFGVRARVLPATDDLLRTWIDVADGRIPFQEWFVARGHADDVEGVYFEGATSAAAAPGVLEALEEADIVLIAPSNPYVSIWPVLAVAEIREALELRRCPVVAVSPLVGGRAVKGPADRMLSTLAGGTDPAHVAGCYLGLIDVLVIDDADAAGAPALEEIGVKPVVTRTLMNDAPARRSLAEAALEAAGALR